MCLAVLRVMAALSLLMFVGLTVVAGAVSPAEPKAYQLEIKRQPSLLSAVGEPLARQPGVRLKVAGSGETATADLVGNVFVTASLVSVSSSNPGSLPSGLAPLPPPPENPTLLGNPRVLARCGVAQYTDLRIDTMGTFKLSFRALMASAESANASLAIGVIHGVAHRLAIIKQPRSAQIRVPLRVPPSISILDAADNTVETGPESQLVIVAFVSASVPLPNQPGVRTYPANETRKAAFRGTVQMSTLMVDSEGTDIVMRFEAEAAGSHYSKSRILGVSAEPFTASDVPEALIVLVNSSGVAGAREPFEVQPVVRLATRNGTTYTYSPLGGDVVVGTVDTTSPARPLACLLPLLASPSKPSDSLLEVAQGRAWAEAEGGPEARLTDMLCRWHDTWCWS